MIIVRITSGMGNQMFQYSFYRLMQKLYPNTEVKLDLTWFYANDDHHGYELERAFGGRDGSRLYINEAGKFEILKVTGLLPNLCKKGGISGQRFEKFRRYPNRILREFTQGSRAPYIVDELNGNITDIGSFARSLDVSKNWYFIGFFIEEAYYKDVIDIVRDEFVFPDFTDNINTELAEEINNTNSVSIHVRRGDYLTTYANMFIPLGEKYYKEAVKTIENRISEPKYFIFSDDSEFVKKEFDWLPNKTIVTNNTGDNSFRDMQLMSLCKHNIIANSTFSQWGALLNKNDGHITVYPSAYLRDRDNEVKTLSNWVRI